MVPKSLLKMMWFVL